jgi:site-specific recombinase XerD
VTLADAIAKYVDLNQSMGMRFHVDEAMLKAFHRHVGDVDLAGISPDVVVTFLQPRRRVTSTWLMKHRALRRFYQYGITRGLVARSPVPTVIPRVTETFVPHIYSDDELRRLLAGVEAHQTRDARCTIAAPTLRAFLLLLYGTGLRLGEALALRREDVDLRAGMILIRDGKFYKSRHLPIGPRLTHALTEYLDTVPDWRSPAPSAFFVNRRGASMPHQTAWWNFASLRERVQVQGRVHDLRHTFAVHRLLAWYREGADVQRRLPFLSTYLGHARIACTQRYLTMIPALLEQASQRFETYARGEAGHG